MAKKLDVSESGIRNGNVRKEKKSAQSEKIGREALRVLSVDFNPSESTTHTEVKCVLHGFSGTLTLH